MPLVIDTIGTVEAFRTAAIRSQVTGTLQKIAIQEGQEVRQGDLLFEIDPRPFRNAFRIAEADQQKLKVQLEAARTQVDRYHSLNSGQLISQEQYQKIQDDARVLEAEVIAGESRLANAAFQLECSSIRAPIAGRTGYLNVHEGDLVRANDSGTLVTINQLSPIYVLFGVPQHYLAALSRYRAEQTLKVRAGPPGTDEEPEMGELAFIDNAVDSATGTIRLKAAFANACNHLWPGQFVAVTVILAEPEVLTVPSSAVQTSQNGQQVFVVAADQTAVLRPVTIERTHGGLAVVSQGLKEGETVVIDGQVRVVPGRAVEVKQAQAPASTRSAKSGGDRDGQQKGKKAM